eukprot:13814577-Alexandrium_andersonii.AAC.1
MAASAWKQPSGWKSRCSEARPSTPGALRRACRNLWRSAPGSNGRAASSGRSAGSPPASPMR